MPSHAVWSVWAMSANCGHACRIGRGSDVPFAT
jgi:hypothetical protein